MTNYIFPGLVFSLVVAIDQLTKHLALVNIEPRETIVVIPNFFNLILTFNPGAAFGLLADLPDLTRYILLGIAASLALGAVLYFFIRDYRHDAIARVALAMIVGGAVGNIIDRLRFGMVVDFLDFYIGANHWPAFNIADSAICVGVFILFLRKPASREVA